MSRAVSTDNPRLVFKAAASLISIITFLALFFSRSYIFHQLVSSSFVQVL